MKKILLSLFVWFVWIISFCNAWTYTFEWNWNNIPWSFVPAMSSVSKNVIISCTFTNSNTDCDWPIFRTKFSFSFYRNSYFNAIYYWELSDTYEITCWSDNSFTFTYDFSTFAGAYGYTNRWFNFMYLSSTRNPDPSYITYTCTFVGDNIIDWSNSWWWGWSCPEVNTWEILSWYILESEVDSNYCVNNDLCPVYENNSLLYINTIEHQSAPVINIDIPLEYDWDSSIDSWVFNLVISWNNVDYEYIDWIITAQNVKPNAWTLNKIITELIPLFVPWLVIILFIWFVFRFVKKIF